MAAHKHAEVIKAWADGAQIEFLSNTPGSDWELISNPHWNPNCGYRIKPSEPERVYPVTQMTGDQLLEYFIQSGVPKDTDSLVVVANKTLEHACDAGQIVTREEFDRAVGDRNERDRAIGFHVAGCIMHALAKNPGLLPSSEKIEEYIAEVK